MQHINELIEDIINNANPVYKKLNGSIGSGEIAEYEDVFGVDSLLSKTKLTSFTIKEFLEREIAPREFILSPIIPTQGLVMIYAPRGIGKTFVSLSVACSVASGASMFGGKWKSPNARKVLFVDGEMPASVLQERFASIIAGMETDFDCSENLKVITQDLQESGITDLSTTCGQRYIEEHLEGVELLILDNLSSLCRSGRENESESWLPLQEWLLSLRRKKISVLIVHHAGKNGSQRGNSKKEDLLDTVVSLKKPKNYDSAEGARFEVHYEKARGFHGEDAKAFEASIKQQEDQIIWQVKELENVILTQALELHEQGFSQRDIAAELEISLSSVNRLLKKFKEEN